MKSHSGISRGHLDYLESFESCAAREVFEETGLKLDPQTISFLTTTNDPMPEENTHYVTIFMRGELVDDEPLPQVWIHTLSGIRVSETDLNCHNNMIDLGT